MIIMKKIQQEKVRHFLIINFQFFIIIKMIIFQKFLYLYFFYRIKTLQLSFYSIIYFYKLLKKHFYNFLGNFSAIEKMIYKKVMTATLPLLIFIKTNFYQISSIFKQKKIIVIIIKNYFNSNSLLIDYSCMLFPLSLHILLYFHALFFSIEKQIFLKID